MHARGAGFCVCKPASTEALVAFGLAAGAVLVLVPLATTLRAARQPARRPRMIAAWAIIGASAILGALYYLANDGLTSPSEAQRRPLWAIAVATYGVAAALVAPWNGVRVWRWTPLAIAATGGAALALLYAHGAETALADCEWAMAQPR